MRYDGLLIGVDRSTANQEMRVITLPQGAGGPRSVLGLYLAYRFGGRLSPILRY